MYEPKHEDPVAVQNESHAHDPQSDHHLYDDAVMGVLRIIVFGGVHIPLDTSSVLAILVYYCNLRTTEAIRPCLEWFNGFLSVTKSDYKPPPGIDRQDGDFETTLKDLHKAIYSKKYWEHKNVWYSLLFLIVKKQWAHGFDDRKEPIKKEIEELKPYVKSNANFIKFKRGEIPDLEEEEKRLEILHHFAMRHLPGFKPYECGGILISKSTNVENIVKHLTGLELTAKKQLE